MRCLQNWIQNEWKISPPYAWVAVMTSMQTNNFETLLKHFWDIFANTLYTPLKHLQNIFETLVKQWLNTSKTLVNLVKQCSECSKCSKCSSAPQSAQNAQSAKSAQSATGETLVEH